MTTSIDPIRTVVGPFDPEATCVKDLKRGDMVVFDSFFGLEQIVGIDDPSTPRNGVPIRHIQLQYALPNESNTRFVERAEHEPITRWKPVIS